MTPMGSLLAQIATEQSLLDAWEVVRDSAYADGEAGQAIEQFEAKAARRVSQMSAQLLGGTWKPSPAHHMKIAKPAGGSRSLAIPCVDDRIVERAILEVLDPIIDPLLMPWSYGFRKGMGVDDALRALVEARDTGNHWVLRADIEDCFDEIPRWPVLHRLAEICPDDALNALVRAIVNRRVAGKDAPRRTRKKGLHQGSPLSPLLANLYLDGFDRAMAERGWQVIRFADDFAIPVRDRPDGERAVADAQAVAATLDLRLNLGKTHVSSFDDGVTFLGQTTTASTGAGAIDSSHPLETSVYVEHPGAVVRTKGERLIVTDGDEKLASVNWRRVRQVVIIGRVGLSTPFLHRALKRGVEVVLADEGGSFVGRFAAIERSVPGVRVEQYDAARSVSRTLRIARGFVLGKLQNQRVMLMRLDRKMQEPLLGPFIRRIDKSRVEAMSTTSLATLRGLEGAGARDYFQAFSLVLEEQWQWHGRARRPPPDPVNAMLSFGYTLLVNEGITSAEAAGLDPHMGFLHQTHTGRPSLALDLIEEFRPILVDSVVFALLGRGQVRPEDFETTDEGGCRMSKEARDIFITGYEKRLLQLMTYREIGRCCGTGMPRPCNSCCN